MSGYVAVAVRTLVCARFSEMLAVAVEFCTVPVSPPLVALVLAPL
jgi:hypothetical protein